MCLEQVDYEVLVGERVLKKGFKFVVDKNDLEKIWCIKVFCKEICKFYFDVIVLDYFSFGKLWMGCDFEVKMQRLVDWMFNYVYDFSFFIFDFIFD